MYSPLNLINFLARILAAGGPYWVPIKENCAFGTPVRDGFLIKGSLPGPNLMNFRKTSKRPLTPPLTLFLENNVALFPGNRCPLRFSFTEKSAT